MQKKNKKLKHLKPNKHINFKDYQKFYFLYY